MSDDVKAVLDEWDALANGATEGPWYLTGGSDAIYSAADHGLIAETFELNEDDADHGLIAKTFELNEDDAEGAPDAAFIAAARAIVPQAAKGYRAVLALRHPLIPGDNGDWATGYNAGLVAYERLVVRTITDTLTKEA